VVALAVVSAPVALEVCQITCESKATQPPPLSHAHDEGHTAHQHMPANDHFGHQHGGAPQLSPVSVPCDHGTDTTPSLVAAKNSDVDVAVSLLAMLPIRNSIATVETRDLGSVRARVSSDRPAIPLMIPLRV
jgi:hypothetical protein